MSEEAAESARDDLYKLFLTTKMLGTLITVTLSHTNEDGTIQNNVYEDVLLSLANRQSEMRNDVATFSTATQAQLIREIPFAPVAGDHTIIQGRQCRVVVVYPEMNRIVRADIDMLNPYA